MATFQVHVTIENKPGISDPEGEKLVGVITQTNLAEVLRSKLLINATVDNVNAE